MVPADLIQFIERQYEEVWFVKRKHEIHPNVFCAADHLEMVIQSGSSLAGKYSNLIRSLSDLSFH
jgi:hypothetical protein